MPDNTDIKKDEKIEELKTIQEIAEESREEAPEEIPEEVRIQDPGGQMYSDLQG